MSSIETAQSVQEMMLRPEATAKVYWRLIAENGEARERPRWLNHMAVFLPLRGIFHLLTVTLDDEVVQAMRNYPGLQAQFGLSFEPEGIVFPLSVEDVNFICSQTTKPNGAREPSAVVLLKAMAGEAPRRCF